MEVKMGTTPNGRDVKYDLDKRCFIAQPVGDSIWLERTDLRTLLAECGWGVEEISWNGCPPGRPRDLKAEAEIEAEARRLFDEVRREFSSQWAAVRAKAQSDYGDDEEAADEFVGHLLEHWDGYPADAVVSEKLRRYIVGGLS